MTAAEVVKYLQAYLSQDRAGLSAADQQGPGAAVVSCMDGRLNRFLDPFRFVIRTAGAVAEPVEGSLGIAAESTGVTFLATHGDCLAYKAAIQYLAASFAGERISDNLVVNLNRHDTKAMLFYLNTRRPLNALPDPNDQRALAELGINYAMQWTASNRTDKPRVGLFIDLRSVLATQPHAWVVSYDRYSGPELAHFLGVHGMNSETVSTHVLRQPMKP